MFMRFLDFLAEYKDRQRMSIALSKGAGMMLARSIDIRRPETWEFSGFSQNGEDGVIDVLRKHLVTSNRYFIEIGCADGIQNNTAWLAVAEQYSGLMIDGNPRLVRRARKTVVRYSIGTESHHLFVTQDNISQLKSMALALNPDIFSLDIDGNDYYIAKALIEGGFRPKIFVVEYNSALGEGQSITVNYSPDFDFISAHPTHLYYGVSLSGWKKFFHAHGYQFITVERNGVNAFFVDPAVFDPVFLEGVEGLQFAENRYQYSKFRIPGHEQFHLIADQDFVTIN